MYVYIYIYVCNPPSSHWFFLITNGSLLITHYTWYNHQIPVQARLIRCNEGWFITSNDLNLVNKRCKDMYFICFLNFNWSHLWFGNHIKTSACDWWSWWQNLWKPGKITDFCDWFLMLLLLLLLLMLLLLIIISNTDGNSDISCWSCLICKRFLSW